MTVRIAMWSGPRNVSTALMRSFEARGDCAVLDEPLYAAYLRATGKDHPGRELILASQPNQAADALAELARARHERPLQFEKHMAQHWQADWPFEAFGPDTRHAFLIRDPVAVVASYAKVRGQPELEDLGMLQLAALLDQVSDRGQMPVVVDGDELRAHPRALLPKLCEALGISFTPRMLSWAPGPRASDGVWAKFWYHRVERSVAFEPPTSTIVECPPDLAGIAAAMRPSYQRLAGLRLRPPVDNGGS